MAELFPSFSILAVPPFQAQQAAQLERKSVVFEEAGRLVSGLVLGASEASLQVELSSGKRQKVKWTQLVFAATCANHSDLARLQSLAQEQAATMDLPLCWECAPDADFFWQDLAQEYFGDKPQAQEGLASLLCLQQAPHYFRRLGKGQYRKASAEVVAQALAAIEKKQQQQAQIAAWVDALQQGQCPETIRTQLYSILFAPDKNSPAYKAVALAAHHAGKGVLPLLQAAGALPSAYDFHWQRFLFSRFPKTLARGLDWSPDVLQAAQDAVTHAHQAMAELPLAPVQAFSIDDSQTSEIDDAFSVQWGDGHTWTIGIHIAVPSLAIEAGGALDMALRERMTTVYFPGVKITMMPPSLVQAFSLDAGRTVAALSLYCQVDSATLAIGACETRLERIAVAANLRHEALEAWVQPDNIAELAQHHAEQPFAAELSALHRIALQLKAAREQQRGKPEQQHRPDYQFLVTLAGGQTWPTGQESVQIRPRLRGSPLDLLVAEWMIVANNYWGGWLAQLGLPAIYRSQASLAAGVKVRMSTRALPHAGMGVPHYAWCSSPLRRYVDLINQGQILAAQRYGNMAALKAPFAPKDASLLGLIHAFEAIYSGARDFQDTMERYWTLRYIAQTQAWQQTATVARPGWVRLEQLPLMLPMPAVQTWTRGERLLLQLEPGDDFALQIGARLLQKLSPEGPAQAVEEDAVEEEGEDQGGADAAKSWAAIPDFSVEGEAELGIIPQD